MTFFALDRAPDLITVQAENQWQTLRAISPEVWQNQYLELRIKQHHAKQEITISASHLPLQRIALRWQQAVPPHLRYLGDHWERGYGDMEWHGLIPERPLPWFFLTTTGEETHGYGVKTGAAAFCFWQVDNSGITLWLDVRNGATGVELAGRELLAATVVTRAGKEGETPFEAAHAFCRQLCDSPVLPAEPVYGGNNWYYAYGRSSHQEILNDSRLMASLAPDSTNRPFMVIDDGWQLCHGDNANGGPWQPNYLFPDMGALAAEMREIGVRPGLWFRPLLTVEKVPESWYFSGPRFTNMTKGEMLDPSIAAVREHVGANIRRMVAEWGFDLIKHDFSTYDILGLWGLQMKANPVDSTHPWAFADRSKTTAEIITQFYKDIAAAAGNALVLGCNTIGHLSAGIFALQRTGDDTSGREWERTRKLGINTLAFRMPHHNTFYACDADCIGLTRDVPWEFNRQWLDVVARSGTALFVSAAPDAVGKEQEEAIRQAFAIASQPQVTAQPLDWLDTTCPKSWLMDQEVIEYDWYGSQGVFFF